MVYDNIEVKDNVLVQEEDDENSGGESIGEDGWGDIAEEGSVDYARDQEDEESQSKVMECP